MSRIKFHIVNLIVKDKEKKGVFETEPRLNNINEIFRIYFIAETK
jgi:hypothetical protein